MCVLNFYEGKSQSEFYQMGKKWELEKKELASVLTNFEYVVWTLKSCVHFMRRVKFQIEISDTDAHSRSHTYTHIAHTIRAIQIIYNDGVLSFNFLVSNEFQPAFTDRCLRRHRPADI